MARFNAATVGALLFGLLPGTLAAQTIAVSIGVRETGVQAPIGSNGGSTGGIEIIDRDLNLITLDGTWQQITFNLINPTTVTGFAGVTANSILEGEWGVLEQLRLLNVDGIDQPIRLWLDDLTSSHRADPPVLLGWEGHNVGDEVIFRAPGFSGSTSQNAVTAGTSLVTDSAAYSGDQSLQMDFQFVDGDPTRWLRVTTFDTAIGGNPVISFTGQVTLMVRGVVVPEPATAALLAFAGAGVLLRRRRG